VEEPRHQVRARYSANTITVYQAYRPEIGLAAAHDGRFPDTWDRDRMTWVLSHYERGLHADRSSWQRTLKQAPARVQWDPERDLHLQPMPYRSLQLGLARKAARLFADEWTVSISDVTPLAHQIHALVTEGDLAAAARRLPLESPYPASDALLAHLRP